MTNSPHVNHQNLKLREHTSYLGYTEGVGLLEGISTDMEGQEPAETGDFLDKGQASRDFRALSAGDRIRPASVPLRGSRPFSWWKSTRIWCEERRNWSPELSIVRR